MDLHDVGLSLGREGLHSRGSHAVFSSTRSALAQTSADGSRDTSPACSFLSPTQRQPRARTTAPTSGSSVRTASAEAAPRLSSLSAASADHSFMASCLQQRDASTVARRLLSARLPGGGPEAWVVVIKVGGPLLARSVCLKTLKPKPAGGGSTRNVLWHR